VHVLEREKEKEKERESFIGPDCAYDICLSQPCNNGGQCRSFVDTDGTASYTCSCPLGISGSQCQFSVCPANACNKWYLHSGIINNLLLSLSSGLYRYKVRDKSMLAKSMSPRRYLLGNSEWIPVFLFTSIQWTQFRGLYSFVRLLKSLFCSNYRKMCSMG
jgi:hypothetical protein